MKKILVSHIKVFLVGLGILFMSGCATTNSLDERDPWEGFNRGVYSFNQVMDDLIFNPVGSVYNAVTPEFVDTGITNFFSNVHQVSVVANDILQFKLGQALNDTMRFLFNSTVGLLGFFDVASPTGLYSSDEDFGQTLAQWGFGSGPYVIVPFFGPSTVRGATGIAVDSALLNPIAYIDDDLTRASLLTLNYIDFKSDILSTADLIEEAALDEYDFVKNAYFEKKASEMSDEDFKDFPVVE
ncbi:MAG TPA: VacJ family lipoprotein [Thiotrichaceae bacterium]|jgi:phospholipid-binding lipoprotein MlaA|nr:VacJ family lipoprotein [Thiotrichaceae bacterium]HIM09004.1 VacJ family lipoprotein [Gammaproteobacteria bacterium]